MDWVQLMTIIGVNVALFGALATIIIWMVNKIDSDVKGIGTRMDAHATRMDGHAARIDQLYTIILSLLQKEKK